MYARYASVPNREPDVVVAPFVPVAGERTECPGRPLDLAGLGHHQAVPLHPYVRAVTQPARVLVDPRTAGIGIESLAGVGGFLCFRPRIAAVTDHAAGRIVPALPLVDDRFQHVRAGLADRLDALVTCEASGGGVLRLRRPRVVNRNHFQHQDRRSHNQK